MYTLLKFYNVKNTDTQYEKYCQVSHEEFIIKSKIIIGCCVCETERDKQRHSWQIVNSPFEYQTDSRIKTSSNSEKLWKSQERRREIKSK